MGIFDSIIGRKRPSKKKFKYRVEVEVHNSSSEIKGELHNIIVWEGEYDLLLLGDGEIEIVDEWSSTEVEEKCFSPKTGVVTELYFHEDDTEDNYIETEHKSSYDTKYFNDKKLSVEYFNSLVKKYVKS